MNSPSIKLNDLLPVETCSACGYLLEVSTPVHGVAVVEPGDLSVCFNCGFLTSFDERLRRVPITDRELQTLERHDPEAYRKLLTAQRLIRLRRIAP